jgi:hypothetical protein
MLSSVSESLAQSADISGGLGGQHLEGDPSRENALVSTNKHHFPPGEEHIGRAVTPKLFGMGLSTDPRPCCSRE